MRFLLLCMNGQEETALLVPVLQSLARKYDNLSINLVVFDQYEPFFHNIPGTHVIAIGAHRPYRWFRGWYSFYCQLRKLGPYTKGIDLQGTRVSLLLRFYFLFSGLKFIKMKRPKKQIRALIRHKTKHHLNLPHLIDFYFAAFADAGLPAKVHKGPWINLDTNARARAHQFIQKNPILEQKKLWIGFAPFASRAQKNWPIDRVSDLIERIQTELGAVMFLFHNGNENKDTDQGYTNLQALHIKYPDTIVAPEQDNLPVTMAIMKHLRLLISMDSISMHLGDLLGLRVISLWGPTHSAAGYGPYGQDANTIVQIPSTALTCRPCSLQGDKPCFRKDLACMQWISTDEVFDKVKEYL